MPTSMERPHPLVLAYQATILGFEPPSYARMNGPGAQYKYVKAVQERNGQRTYPPLTCNLIQAHLRGDITVAACLVAPTGEARASALDIDAGGEQMLTYVLDLAEAQGLTGFAQASENEEHQGGHVWFLFSEFTQPQRLRRLAQQLAEQAGIKKASISTYPTRQTIRLPLGVHRWTGKRGHLFLPQGHILKLDAGEHVVRQAVRALRDLSQNNVSLLPSSPDAPVTRASTVRPSESSQEGRATISRYNRQTDLISLLESSGGRVAQRMAHGGALMHCPCPHHKHGDATPSLEIKPAKNRQKYGDYVAFGYAPGCLFYTEQGQVIDAFGVWCRIENVSPSEAVKLLS